MSTTMAGAQRSITLTLVGTCLASVATIVAVSLWLTNAANNLAVRNTNLRVANALQSEIERVRVSVRDYAEWPQAFEWVTQGGPDDVYDNIGVGASEDQTFDIIYLLDADGAPLYAYQSGMDGSDTAIVDLPTAKGFAASVSTLPITPYQPIDASAILDDGLAILAGGRVQPYEVDGLHPDDLPIMVAGLLLSDEKLALMANRLLLNSLAIHPMDIEITPGKGCLSLFDVHGQPIAQLVWDMPRPGDQLFRQVTPAIIGICLLFMMVSLLVVKNAARQNRALQQEHKTARTDGLTGLMNRVGLDELVQTDQIAEALDTGRIALLYLDLNEFKALNDNFGHEAGDKALQIMAKRLRAAIRDQDYAVRLGGDEFLCVILDAQPQTAASTIAHRILERAATPIRAGKTMYKIAPAIGLAVASPGAQWDHLLIKADAAMFSAKKSKLEKAVVYHADAAVA